MSNFVEFIFLLSITQFLFNFVDSQRYNYLNSFPGIRSYMNEVINKAKEKGYTRTLMNRKRVIEELKKFLLYMILLVKMNQIKK